MTGHHSTFDTRANRRRFLRYLAGSASVAYAGGGSIARALEAPNRLPDPMVWAPRDLDHLIATPKEAINVFDFEPVMQKNVPPAHFGFMASGIDDEVTLRANREGFLKYQLRPRRLVDVSKVDMTMRIFGETYDTPIMLAPTGGHRGYHPDGEIATARGAKSGSSFTRPTSSRSPGITSSARKRRAAPPSPSPSTAAAAAIRKPCSACSARTPAIARAAMNHPRAAAKWRGPSNPCTTASTSRASETFRLPR